jgi:hypothetical protein
VKLFVNSLKVVRLQAQWPSIILVFKRLIHV